MGGARATRCSHGASRWPPLAPATITSRRTRGREDPSAEQEDGAGWSAGYVCVACGALAPLQAEGGAAAGCGGCWGAAGYEEGCEGGRGMG